MPVRLRALLCACLLVVLSPSAALAATDVNDLSDQWLPRSDGAEWVYDWTDTDYSPTPRRERYRVQSRAGTQFRLRWEELDTGPYETPSAGTVDYNQTEAGLINLNYASTQPPPQFPILCASAADCGNSLAGAHYLLIWGTRSPTLAEPLLVGTRWNSLGGAANDVSSASRYLGREKIRVPAFPEPVEASKVQAEITQAGAIGDPYGSGVRTTWWVRGVGPVRIEFRHVAGETTQATLQSTTLKPLPAPPDVNLLPLNRGNSAEFRWRNSRHMKRWSRQRFDVAEVVNATARVDVKHLSGPINVAGSYTFATRLSGVFHDAAAVRAATRARFPALGPRSVSSDRRRRFFTPYDLMVYGFNPVVPVYGGTGETWRSSRDSRDFSVFGVTGTSRQLKPVKLRVRGRSYTATPVQSDLTQRGFRFGSGRRTSYFAPGRGLVKLVFRHRDGSVSTVERTK